MTFSWRLSTGRAYEPLMRMMLMQEGVLLSGASVPLYLKATFRVDLCAFTLHASIDDASPVIKINFDRSAIAHLAT